MAAQLLPGLTQETAGTVENAEATKLEALRQAVRMNRDLKPRDLRLLRELEAKAAGRDVVGTLEALAARLGITKRTAIAWKKEGLPVEEGGVYDVAKVKAWRARGFKAPGEGREEGEEEGDGGVDWKAKHDEEKARLAELKRRHFEGQLIDREEAARHNARICAAFVAALDGFARAFPPMLEGRTKQEMEVIITAQVRNLRERLVDPLAEVHVADPSRLAGEDVD